MNWKWTGKHPIQDGGTNLYTPYGGIAGGGGAAAVLATTGMDFPALLVVAGSLGLMLFGALLFRSGRNRASENEVAR